MVRAIVRRKASSSSLHEASWAARRPRTPRQPAGPSIGTKCHSDFEWISVNLPALLMPSKEALAASLAFASRGSQPLSAWCLRPSPLAQDDDRLDGEGVLDRLDARIEYDAERLRARERGGEGAQRDIRDSRAARSRSLARSLPVSQPEHKATSR